MSFKSILALSCAFALGAYSGHRYPPIAHHHDPSPLHTNDAGDTRSHTIPTQPQMGHTKTIPTAAAPVTTTVSWYGPRNLKSPIPDVIYVTFPDNRKGNSTHRHHHDLPPIYNPHTSGATNNVGCPSCVALFEEMLCPSLPDALKPACLALQAKTPLAQTDENAVDEDVLDNDSVSWNHLLEIGSVL
ncbi:hypothetical protein SISNIDRAFT_524408 [Sistotremastrum niveocremeum HHB9708]|uniref:Uncharacterized protein n=1 Tax=Sistotremastrum niveocremeum HHB9708 TaxID=1314777 RepID=A0A164QYI6_9AGAM|nr:hypothetical protein SISNIDRAFT_524408 [Sistotremastrum niveocremeum HHB9708]